MIENGKQYHNIPDYDLPLWAQAAIWAFGLGFTLGVIVVQSLV